MPDSPIPPLVDLSRNLQSVLLWSTRCQSHEDNPGYYSVATKEDSKRTLLAHLDALEQAIVRARGVL